MKKPFHQPQKVAMPDKAQIPLLAKGKPNSLSRHLPSFPRPEGTPLPPSELDKTKYLHPKTVERSPFQPVAKKSSRPICFPVLNAQ